MPARESRFIQCVIEALRDSIGADDRSIVIPRPSGWYELPAYARRGIQIPGVEPLRIGETARRFERSGRLRHLA